MLRKDLLKNTFSILCLGTALAMSHKSNAQSKSPQTDTIGLQYLQPVEVRALRAGSHSPFAKTNLDAKQIQQQNLGQDLPMLLQYTPSAVITSDAGAGVGYTGIHIRGVDATRINVTMNGIPMNDPEEQAVFFVDIPDIASSTNSIQIQRGVGTSTNGAGAFGATISIDNMHQMDKAGAELSSSFGSFNTMKNTLKAGTGLLKGGWQFDVRLSKVSSDGYIQRSASDLKSLQFIAGWQANKNTSLHFVVLTGIEKTGQAWDGVPQDSLSTNRTYNELGQKPDGTYYNNQTDNYQQDYYQLFADHTFSKYLTGHIGLFLTRGKGYYQEYKQDQTLSDYGIENPIIDTSDIIRQLWLDNYYYGSVFSLLYNRHKTQVTFGGGWTQFENLHYGIIKWAQNGSVPDNYKWYQHDAQKNDLNVYVKAQQQIGEKTYLFGDVQYRNVAYFVNGFQDYPNMKPAVNYNFFNPKAGITYMLENNSLERQKIYASVAVGHREPNRADYEIDSNKFPKPETLYDVEAGYVITRSNWNVGANIYYMYYQDQLVQTGQINDVGAYTQTNVAKSYRAGIELQAAVKPLSWLTIHANGTFSQNKIGNINEYIDDWDNGDQIAVQHSNTDISFSPNVIAAGTVTFAPFQHMRHGQHFELGITDKYVGRQYLDNTSNTNRSIDPYNYCNVLIQYSIKAHPFREISATLMLNNIFNNLYSTNGYVYEEYKVGNTYYNSNYYYPQAGFNVLGGITLKW